LRGIGAFFGGVAFVVGTPRLWPKAMVPVVTALLLMTALGVLGVREAMALAHHALGSGLLSVLAGFALGVAAVLLAVVVGVSLAQPLSGWALGAIMRAQQAALGMKPQGEHGGLGAMLASFGSALFALAVGVPCIVMLTATGWIFPPATVVTVPLKVLLASALLAWDLLDYPLSSRGLTLVERLRWCAAHAGCVMGFGLSAMLIFAVPGLGLFALPCGVAGATRLVAAREPRSRRR
jgi:CysZ protein